MNLSYLKYAVEVEKTGSITKAAQNFYMNQPHLSKIIRELERDLGCNGGISVTSEVDKGSCFTLKFIGK